MTLGMAWVRVTGSIRELIVISDSRLSGGQSWDGNPKIMMLPRSDAVISFAGSTSSAYPLMLQAYNAVAMHQPALTRSMDITDLKGHLIRMFNDTLKSISNLPVGQLKADNPDAVFLLSGYSWKFKNLEFGNYITTKTHRSLPFAQPQIGGGKTKIRKK